MAITETTLIEAGIQVGLLDEADLKSLRLLAKRERLRLIEVVTRTGRFPEAALYQALADIRGIPYLQPFELKADVAALELLPRNIRTQRLMLPLNPRNGTRLLALADPDDRISIDRMERAAEAAYQPALADPDALRAAVRRYSESGLAPAPGPGSAEQDPVELLDDIMKEVYLRRASDIHFEPQEAGMRIRLRVDGQMQEYSRILSEADEEALMNRIKVLSDLDIAEQRMAQDGALKYTILGWDIAEMDIRVATVPTRWGERATMRILGQETGDLSLTQLGMPDQLLEEFRVAIKKPYGMILVTGPTGSGKSTTLYAALRELDINAMNILTVEDPVEQTVAGVSQVQVSVKVSFAQALRSFLRHDPDVILVGEIRDKETAEIGLRSAMTGHLVLSTLHTNDSIGAVTRLADIGAERFLIGSTLIGVLAQRLGRRLCVHCRKKRPALPEELAHLGMNSDDQVEIFEPEGCSFCVGSGFRGRIGLFEMFWVSPEIGLAISEGAGERQLRKTVRNMKTLWQDCCDKILNGDVYLHEVLHLKPEEG